MTHPKIAAGSEGALDTHPAGAVHDPEGINGFVINWSAPVALIRLN